MNIKKILVSSGAAVLMLGATIVPAFAATETVYDALPSVSPETNYPSQPFQAQQTNEFGDYIHLGGTARTLNTVTVTMSDWAKYSDYTSDVRYQGDSVNWTHPITLNVYNVVPGTPNTVGTLLGTVTQTITIPWRPESDPSCGSTSNGTGWLKDGVCYNYSGIAFNAVFDLSSLNVTLPDDIIVSVAYNTQTYGLAPIGVNGPYNSLNVAVPPNQLVSVGSDNNTDATFWNSTTGTGGIFREDIGWTPYGTVAMQIQANEPAIDPPTDKKQCKKDGWKTFNNPAFKNQGQCVSYVKQAKEEEEESKGDKDKNKEDKENDHREENQSRGERD